MERPGGGGGGVKVATVMSDIKVKEEEYHIYASKTSHFTIHGSGFMSMLDPSEKPVVVLAEVPEGAFTVGPSYAQEATETYRDPAWTDESITLWLKEGKKWANVLDSEQKAIHVISIDTGAGPKTFGAPGIEVARVRADDDSVKCDDSCYYAMDGTCDEEPWGTDYYSSYGYSSDDLFSNYGSYGSYAGYSGDSWSSDLGGQYGFVAACDPGTDCSDCNANIVLDGDCSNTCKHARDGVCDDPRIPNFAVCKHGTDCQDCGPWGATNSTSIASSADAYSWSSYWDRYYESSDEADWYGYGDDDFFVNDDDADLWAGQENNRQGRYPTFVDHKSTHREEEGAGSMFMDILWAVVVLIGGSVSLGFCLLAYRHLKGGGGAAIPYNPVSADEDQLEMASLKQDVTPDVITT